MSQDLSLPQRENYIKGNTEMVAEEIHSQIGGDMYRINKIQAVMKERNYLPEPIGSLEGYDIIFLGYPIYYHQMPKEVSKFLDSLDIGNRTIIPFSTHSGSGMGRSIGEIERLCPHAHIKKGIAIPSAVAKAGCHDQIHNWLIETGMI